MENKLETVNIRIVDKSYPHRMMLLAHDLECYLAKVTHFKAMVKLEEVFYHRDGPSNGRDKLLRAKTKFGFFISNDAREFTFHFYDATARSHDGTREEFRFPIAEKTIPAVITGLANAVKRLDEDLIREHQPRSNAYYIIKMIEQCLGNGDEYTAEKFKNQKKLLCHELTKWADVVLDLEPCKP